MQINLSAPYVTSQRHAISSQPLSNDHQRSLIYIVCLVATGHRPTAPAGSSLPRRPERRRDRRPAAHALVDINKIILPVHPPRIKHVPVYSAYWIPCWSGALGREALHVARIPIHTWPAAIPANYLAAQLGRSIVATDDDPDLVYIHHPLDPPADLAVACSS